MKYPKINDVKRPLKKGELVLVPCFTFNHESYLHVVPVIDHPHTDIESGQPEAHWHTDYRFVREEQTHSFHRWGIYGRIEKSMVDSFNMKLDYFILPVVDTRQKLITSTSVIHKAVAKMKHRCIHKGKCPHRGYDLSQTKAKDGVITCPLHGLQFDANTKKLIEQI